MTRAIENFAMKALACEDDNVSSSHCKWLAIFLQLVRHEEITQPEESATSDDDNEKEAAANEL